MAHHVLIMSVNPGLARRNSFPAAPQSQISSKFGVADLLSESKLTAAWLSIPWRHCACGLKLLVAGNAVFGKGDIRENAKKLFGSARAATLTRA